MELFTTPTDIYNMQLHEVMEFGNLTVTRVPGGWKYDTYHPTIGGANVTSIRVPFSNEFNPKKKEGKKINEDDIHDVINHLSGRLLAIGKIKESLQHVGLNKDLVQRLLKKYNKQIICNVVDYKIKEWNGTENRVYLRVSTLFKGPNFDRYHSEYMSKSEPSTRGIDSWRS